MLSWDRHVDCCGVLHIFDFPCGKESSKVAIQELENLIRKAHSRGRRDDYSNEHFYFSELIEDETYISGCFLLEITLTDDQLCANNIFWAKNLKRLKFRKGARWRNPNTGNYVTIFTFSKKPREKAPYDW